MDPINDRYWSRLSFVFYAYNCVFFARILGASIQGISVDISTIKRFCEEKWYFAYYFDIHVKSFLSWPVAGHSVKLKFKKRTS